MILPPNDNAYSSSIEDQVESDEEASPENMDVELASEDNDLSDYLEDESMSSVDDDEADDASDIVQPDIDDWTSPPFAKGAKDRPNEPFSFREDIVTDSGLHGKIQEYENELRIFMTLLQTRQVHLQSVQNFSPSNHSLIQNLHALIAGINEQIRMRRNWIQRIRGWLNFRPNISACLGYTEAFENRPQPRQNRSLSSNAITCVPVETAAQIKIRSRLHSYAVSELVWYRYLREMKMKCTEFPYRIVEFWRKQRISNSVSNYRARASLGEGTFGAIYKVRKRDVDNELFALKIITAPNAEPDVMVEFETFLNLSSSAYFPHLLSFFFDHSINYFVFVMDYIEGIDMFHAMYVWFPQLDEEDETFGEEVRYIYLFHLINAVCAFHTFVQQGHNDIKPNNMMITRDGSFKLIDFGKTGKSHFYHQRYPAWNGFSHETLHAFVKKELRDVNRANRLMTLRDAARQEEQLREIRTVLSNVNYTAPESIIAINIDYNQRFLADWWAVGIITYEMFTGFHPFAGHPVMGSNTYPDYRITTTADVLDYENNENLASEFMGDCFNRAETVSFVEGLLTNRHERVGQQPNSADVIEFAKPRLPFFSEMIVPEPPPLPPQLISTSGNFDVEVDLNDLYGNQVHLRPSTKTQLFVHYDIHGL